MKAVQTMTRNVIYIRQEDTIQIASDLMRQWEIRHLPVVSAGKLVGIVSDRDILPVLSTRGALGQNVTEIMTRKVISSRPSDTISHIANIMSINKLDCVPILEDDGSLVGLITSMDLVELLREKEILDLSRSIPWTYNVHSELR